MRLHVISSSWPFGAPPRPCPRVDIHLRWRDVGNTLGSWDASITSAESRKLIPDSMLGDYTAQTSRSAEFTRYVRSRVSACSPE
jgi:hypothetical protein